MIPFFFLPQNKYGALPLNRETSKELGDRMAGRYPVPPADVNNTYLVEHMVCYMLAIHFYICCFSPSYILHRKVTSKVRWKLNRTWQIVHSNVASLPIPFSLSPPFLHLSPFTEFVAEPCQEAPHDDSSETSQQHGHDLSGEHHEQPGQQCDYWVRLRGHPRTHDWYVFLPVFVLCSVQLYFHGWDFLIVAIYCTHVLPPTSTRLHVPLRSVPSTLNVHFPRPLFQMPRRRMWRLCQSTIFSRTRPSWRKEVTPRVDPLPASQMWVYF